MNIENHPISHLCNFQYSKGVMTRVMNLQALFYFTPPYHQNHQRSPPPTVDHQAKLINHQPHLARLTNYKRTRNNMKKSLRFFSVFFQRFESKQF